MIQDQEQAKIITFYAANLKQLIIDAHEVDNLEWMDPQTVLALNNERKRMKDALRGWRERERKRLASQED